MSSATIIVLILGGIVALLIVGYLNNAVEKTKLDKARKKAELTERQQRIEALSEALPRQLLTVAIKQLLHKLELHFVEGVLANDAQNKKMQGRALLLKERLELGEQYAIGNPETNTQTEEQVKEVRFQLESLQTQLTRAAEERLIPVAQLKPAVAHIQLQLINLYLDYFRASGQRFMQQGQPRQARLAYERAVKLLKRQTAPQFAQQLPQFEQLLDKASKLVLEQTQNTATRGNELSGAVESEQTDEWKKKQLYD
ncbi:MAG: hypothetical protein M0Q29_02510 [Thiopseudomonas sp.]|nr:hypothetical protein [Thiopseudomonas sp.]MCK9464742.1 hypothetical protein [Thiopseudomonas sp.]